MCTTKILYLDRFGGDYVPASHDDAKRNASVIFDRPRTLPPWPGDDIHWADLTACVRTALAPFNIAVTETDPGDVPHLEIVFTDQHWDDPAITHLIPSACRPGNEIEVIFGHAFSNPTRACEVAMDGFAEMTALLGPAENCLDFTSPAADCGVRFFQDLEMQCVDASLQPAQCRCGGTTENTYAALAARFPACP